MSLITLAKVHTNSLKLTQAIITAKVRKAYKRSDVTHLLDTFRGKSLEAANVLRQFAMAFTDQESQAAFIQLATAIERDALERTDLSRPVDQKIVDYMASILSKYHEREQP